VTPEQVYPADEIQQAFEAAITALQKVDAAWTDDAVLVTGIAIELDDPANRGRHFPSNDRLESLRQTLVSIEWLLDDYTSDDKS
jgi:hypothetical protein